VPLNKVYQMDRAPWLINGSSGAPVDPGTINFDPKLIERTLRERSAPRNTSQAEKK
jgi:hypothetical protein